MAARGQTPDRIRRIGVLSAFAEDDPEERGNIAAFRQALEKLGWTDGGNVRIDYRWGGADAARIRVYAPELVGLKPDVFLVRGEGIRPAPRASPGNSGGPHAYGRAIPCVRRAPQSDMPDR